jgi:hypothetical protein
MALIPSSRYPGQIDAAAAYPQGKARNAGSYQDGTGTPLEKDWVNDQFGFQQALLADAGIVPSGSPDQVGASQYLDAVRAIASATPRRELVIFEDFKSDHVTTSSGNEAWDERWTTSAPSLTYSSVVAYGDDALGIGGFTNASAAAITARYRKADGMFQMASLRRIACRVRLYSIASGMGFRVGTIFPSTPTPCISAVFQPATSPNWLLQTDGGFVNVNTGVPVVAGVFYVLDLRHDGAGHYTLSVNGSAPVAPAGPSVPDPAASVTPEWVLSTPASGANRTHNIDYVYALVQTPARGL